MAVAVAVVMIEGGNTIKETGKGFYWVLRCRSGLIDRAVLY